MDSASGTTSSSSSQLAPRGIHNNSDHGNNANRSNRSLLLTSQLGATAAAMPFPGIQDSEVDKSSPGQDCGHDRSTSSSRSSCPEENTKFTAEVAQERNLPPVPEDRRGPVVPLSPQVSPVEPGVSMTQEGQTGVPSDEENNEEKDHNAARCHEHGMSTLVPVSASRTPTGRRSTTVENDPRAKDKDGNANSMADPKSVHFGWIRHPATKAWRDAVKKFSQNRKDFPSWTEDICQKVKDMLLKGDKGIDRFVICRRPTGGSKKIFDKGESKGDCLLAKWSPATDQEILDRTKQRFMDDRKPPAAAQGEKRSRGRPPKVVVPNDASLAPPTAFSDLDKKVIQIQLDLQSLEASHNNGLLGAGVAGSLEESNHSSRTLTFPGATVPPSMLTNLMQGLDSMQQRLDLLQQLLHSFRGRMGHLLQNQMNVALSKAGDAVMTSVADSAALEDHETAASLCEQPPSKKSKLVTNDGISICSPFFPVSAEHVCLGCIHHLGTIKWVDVVNALARDTEQYPNWKDAMVDLVIARLEESGCSAVLVSLDSRYNGESIDNTQWSIATKEEFTEWTRKQFLDCREARMRELMNVI